jgi:hypothetical protein
MKVQWHEPDRAARRRRIEEIWTPDGDNFSRRSRSGATTRWRSAPDAATANYLSGNGPLVGDAAIMAPSFLEGRHV